jgi:hypothetical protein
MRRLYTSAHRVMKESADVDLANTIKLMSDQLEDVEAQKEIDELIVILQGRERAADRLQQAVAWVLANYEEDNEEDESGPTQVSLSPSTNDKD